MVIVVLAIALLHGGPIMAQSVTVPIQTRKRLIAQPLQTIAQAMRSEQTIRTRNGIGCRKVHIRPQDEIWLVSARQDKQCELTSQKLVNGQWVNASMAELIQAHALDKQKTSLVYVHGNRTNEVYARSRGLQFYENTFNNELCSGPIRFIIYAWRSEREKVRVGPDFRVKLDRSVAIGPTFACFVNQFEDRRLILSGFSLGAQVVLSGLVQLQAANDVEPKVGKYRIALVTPALQACDSLISVAPLPVNPVADETVVFINRKDIALLAAKVSEKVNKQLPAVTLDQIAKQSVPGMTNRVVIEDMTNCVSRYHSISRYSARSCRLRTEINRMADELRCEAQVTTPLRSQWQSGSIEVIEPVDEVIIFEPVSN